jgi:hypothetical protein
MRKFVKAGKNAFVKFDTDKLEAVERELGRKLAARIGIMGDHASRTYTGNFEAQGGNYQTNADIGLIHEKGSYSRKIPRRSFLEEPLRDKLPDQARKFGEYFNKDLDAGRLAGAYEKLGILCENIVQMAFRTRGFGKWAPNSARTVARKGSDSPLIDTAQLRKSITSAVVAR